MKNINTNRLAWAVFAVFAIFFALLSYQKGKSPTDISEALQIASSALGPVLLVFALFATWAWRLPLFKGWLVPFPDLNGTWQGTIQTSWINPDTGVPPEPVSAILSVKQSFTRISCVMRTAEMTSQSYLSGFWLDDDEQIKRLGYSYLSLSKREFKVRNAHHEGSVVFDIVEHPTRKLIGRYWTDRQTCGEIELTLREKRILVEFPEDMRPRIVSHNNTGSGADS